MRFAPELWHHIGSFLTPHHKWKVLELERSAYNAFSDDEKKYRDIWRKILKDDVWTDSLLAQGMQPILIGDGLKTIISGSTKGGPKPFIILSIIYNSEIPTDRPAIDVDLFLKSLRSTKIDRLTQEVEFDDFILGVFIVGGPHLLQTPNLDSLVDDKGRFTRIMTYQGSSTPQKVEVEYYSKGDAVIIPGSPLHGGRPCFIVAPSPLLRLAREMSSRPFQTI
jgi:hypothetical protein